MDAGSCNGELKNAYLKFRVSAKLDWVECKKFGKELEKKIDCSEDNFLIYFCFSVRNSLYRRNKENLSFVEFENFLKKKINWTEEDEKRVEKRVEEIKGELNNYLEIS